MRELNFTGSVVPEESESRKDNSSRRRMSPTHIGLLPSALFWLAVVTVVYSLTRPLVRIDPTQLAIATTLTGSRITDNSIVINGAVGQNLIAGGVTTISLRVNDVERPVSISNQGFTTRIPLIRGRNVIQAFAGNIASKPLTVLADLPRYDIWIELTWEGVGDVDLYLLPPNGETVYYLQRTSSIGARLDYDNVTAEGPEHILM